MGTAYNLYEDYHLGELTINEMSNQLALALIDCTNNYHYSKEMSPKEMAKIFLYGLQVCSYWMDTNELKEMIRNHVDKEIY